MSERVTWKSVLTGTFPALVAMAKTAGLDTTGWKMINPAETPVLVLGDDDAKFCRWSTARECRDYMQAWIDSMSIVNMQQQKENP